MPAIHVQSVTSYGKCRWADGGLSASSSPNWVVHPITKSHACGSKRLNACCSNQTLTCLRLPPSAVLQKQRAFTSISAGSPAPHPPPTEGRQGLPERLKNNPTPWLFAQFRRLRVAKCPLIGRKHTAKKLVSIGHTSIMAAVARLMPYQ